MRLSFKVYLSLIPIIIAVLFGTAQMYLYVSKESKECQLACENDLAVLEVLHSLERLFGEMGKAERSFLITRESKYGEQAQNSLEEFQKQLLVLRDDPAGEELMPSARRYGELLATVVSNISSGRITRGRQVSLQLSELRQEIRNTTADAYQRRIAELSSRMRIAHRTMVRTVNTVWLASFIILVATLCFTIVFTRRLVRPARHITAVLKKAMNGDLGQTTELKPGDEIGEIGQNLDKLLAQLKTFDQLKAYKIIEEKEKLETVLDLLPQGIIITDGEGKLALMNDTCLQFFGLSLDEVAEKPLSEMISVDNQLKDLIAETLTSRKKISSKEVKISTGTEPSRQRTLLVNTGLSRGRDGEISQVILLFTEVVKKEKEGLKEKIKHALGDK